VQHVENCHPALATILDAKQQQKQAQLGEMVHQSTNFHITIMA